MHSSRRSNGSLMEETQLPSPPTSRRRASSRLARRAGGRPAAWCSCRPHRRGAHGRQAPSPRLLSRHHPQAAVCGKEWRQGRQCTALATGWGNKVAASECNVAIGSCQVSRSLHALRQRLLRRRNQKFPVGAILQRVATHSTTHVHLIVSHGNLDAAAPAPLLPHHHSRPPRARKSRVLRVTRHLNCGLEKGHRQLAGSSAQLAGSPGGAWLGRRRRRRRQLRVP